MPDTLPSTEAWVDIVPPGHPGAIGESAILVSLVLAVAFLFFLGIYLFNQPRQQARRKLRRLLRELPALHNTTRPACFQVTHCLRQAFSQDRLHAIRFADRNQADWQQYVDRLTRYCFGAEPASVPELERILREALVWSDAKRVTD